VPIVWALNNRTSYAAERNWTRDKSGAHLWIVAVRATFDIARSGKLGLSDVQKPPVLAPEYFGKPGESSLRADSDLLAMKPCTDVVLDAHAHVPGGKRASQVSVSMRIAQVTKTLLVHGDRVYYKSPTGGLTTSSPQPFSTRAIRYEAAYGGADRSATDPSQHAHDARNPVGVGFALEESRLVYKPAPSIEYPNADPTKTGPAGFGPIDPAWSPRRERAGTYDAQWEKKKRPLLPDDYDDLFASSAPDDQRAQQHLRGGERVELQNLTPESQLRFELPKLYFTFSTHFGDRAEEHRSRLTSVFIEPEHRRVSLVWQTQLQVAPKDDEYLDYTVIREKPYLT
jgi:hypothetical protein